ncbi:hypothetical protein DESC_780319 [Desulfosarcina cetonica]|nr:hypothetical protein DESC_780319 [Desulfosarcina cetonica]
MGAGVTGRFAEGKAVQHGRVGLAGFAQKVAALAAEAVAHGDFVELIDDRLHRLAGQDHLLGVLDAPLDGNDADRFAVGAAAGGHGAIHGRCPERMGGKGIVVALIVLPQLAEHLLEEERQRLLLRAAAQRSHEFVLHQSDHDQGQQPVDHRAIGAGLVENQSLPGQAVGQMHDPALIHAAGCHQLSQGLGGGLAEGRDQVQFRLRVSDHHADGFHGGVGDGKRHHALFADNGGGVFEFF